MISLVKYFEDACFEPRGAWHETGILALGELLATFTIT